MEAEQRVATVTGAEGGIGRAVVRHLSKDGLLAAARNTFITGQILPFYGGQPIGRVVNRCRP